MIRNLIAFLCLVENGEGFMSKSPEYIIEKYEAMKTHFPMTNLLDENNKKKYEKYLKAWGLK